MDTVPLDKIELIPMEEIFSDEGFNCRGRIAPIDVAPLARSIAEKGLLQPIVLQPFTMPEKPKVKYRIVAGHRRHAACKVNKMTTIPAIIRQGLNEDDARILNLTENLEREELNILQEAFAIRHFREKGRTRQWVAAKTGTSDGWVQVRFMLLDMPKEIQAEAAAGLLTQQQIRQLYGLKSDTDRFEAIKRIKLKKHRDLEKDLTPKKAKPSEKKDRGIEERITMQSYIQDEINGNDIVTRMLGWCNGFVSNREIHEELKAHYKEKGKNYRIPKLEE